MRLSLHLEGPTAGTDGHDDTTTFAKAAVVRRSFSVGGGR